jgi:hypothetical protein
MLSRAIVASVLLLILGNSSAFATFVISEDRGGQIGQYVEEFTNVRGTGERVVIDGPCLSACTMILGFIPTNRICVTGRARLGFHAAWRPDSDGRQVTSDMGTRFLWNVYPHAVRRWITRQGGLSRHMIFLEGRELRALYRECDGTVNASNGAHEFTLTPVSGFPGLGRARD